MIKLGVQDNNMLPEGLVEKAKYLKSIGLDSFEIDGNLIKSQYEEVKEMSKIIDVATVCGGYRNWIGSYTKEERDICIADIKELIDIMSGLKINGIVVPAAWALGTYRLPGLHPQREDEETFNVLSDSLKKLDDYCEGKNVKIYLEPLNRYQDFMINRIEQAVKLIEVNELKNTQITADAYHMNIEEDDFVAAFVNNLNHIGHIHLAENHRFEPGTGTIDFASLFSALENAGYDGYAVLECRFKTDEITKFEKAIKYLQDSL